MTRPRDNIELNGQRIRGLHYWKQLRSGVIVADGHLRVRDDMPAPAGFVDGAAGERAMHVRIRNIYALPQIDEVRMVHFGGRHIRDADTRWGTAVDRYRIAPPAPTASE